MFSSKTSNFERLLDKATSKLLLEPEWEAIMQICDILRQGDVQPSVALTSIRRKIDNDNYHTCNYGLLVLESVVKNCGASVHNAIATKEFMNYMHQLAKKKQDSLKAKVLELIQVWSHAFRGNPACKVIQDTFNAMKEEGFSFPALRESDAMFASEKAPDWMDGEHCHECICQFTTFNRKHHCRACGQVFCQKCSSKVSTIPKFGIEKEVRVCNACYDLLNKPAAGGAKKEEQLPAEYLNSPLSKQSQAPPARSETEIREEEELQLALALSQSEAEAKKNKTKPSHSPQSAPTNKAEALYSQPQKQQQQPSVMDTSDMDPELARYLNRNYWQQKSFELKTTTATTQPSAPTAANSAISVKNNDIKAEQEQNQAASLEEGDEERMQFLSALSSSIEIFMNRMKSNSQRHRCVANDSSVQSLFMTLTAMHPTLLNYMQQLEASRAYYEGLQDKLGQLKDARDALDVLREEHREKERRRVEEAEKLRQVQLAQKLEVLRQQKQVYLEYQRQMALQRMQEQELEMRKRLDQQKQEHELKAKQYAYPQAYQPIPGGTAPQYHHPGALAPSQGYPPHMAYPSTQPSQHPMLQQQQQQQHSYMRFPQQQQPLHTYQQQPPQQPQLKYNGFEGYTQGQPLTQQQQTPQQPLTQQQQQQQTLQQPSPQQQQTLQQSLPQQPSTAYPPQQQTYPAFNPAYEQAFQGSQSQPTAQDAGSIIPATTLAQQPAMPSEAELINFD